MLAIGSRYFDVLRSPLLRGRSFTDIDGLPGRDVAIVNQRFAEMYFAGVDPIGHSVQLTQNPSLRTVSGTPASALTIVGVSQTIRQRNTREVEADPVVYVPRPAVIQSNRATLLVRTARNQAETTAVLREEIRALDPDMPIFNVRTLETDLANQRWPLIVDRIDVRSVRGHRSCAVCRWSVRFDELLRGEAHEGDRAADRSGRDCQPTSYGSCSAAWQGR